MLRSVKELEKYSVGATDGTIGTIDDFYFDDQDWVIRYVVVDTGAWLTGRKVLISPFSIGYSDQASRVFPVSISREQIKNSPSIDTAKPVSRQHEIRYLGYYGYPYYWGGAGLWGGGAFPGAMLAGSAYGGSDAEYLRAAASNARIAADAEEKRHKDDNPHLRICNAVEQYHVHAADGDIGHVDGFLVEEQSWAIRYLILNTSNWWIGHQVLVAPDWIGEVSWAYSKVTVSLDRQAIKDAPAFDPAQPLERDEEVDIYAHYGHRGYWQEKREHAGSR